MKIPLLNLQILNLTMAFFEGQPKIASVEKLKFNMFNLKTFLNFISTL
jgi:hypothetical protein